jgi:CheY-like chemotaxis protein
LEVEPARAHITSTDVAGGSETVLLVEDAPAVRELAALTLREKGYTVFEALNGEDGCAPRASKMDRIDLVLTDVVMPVMAAKKWQMHFKNLIRRRGSCLPRIFRRRHQSTRDTETRRHLPSKALHDRCVGAQSAGSSGLELSCRNCAAYALREIHGIPPSPICFPRGRQ